MPSRAFLAGLLCEVGALVCLAVDGERYAAMRAEARTEPERRAAETRSYGDTSFAIGAELLWETGLAPAICKAVHGIDNDPLSTLVRLARRASGALIDPEARGVGTWPTVLSRLVADEGLRLDGDALRAIAEEAFSSTAKRLRGLRRVRRQA